MNRQLVKNEHFSWNEFYTVAEFAGRVFDKTVGPISHSRLFHPPSVLKSLGNTFWIPPFSWLHHSAHQLLEYKVKLSWTLRSRPWRLGRWLSWGESQQDGQEYDMKLFFWCIFLGRSKMCVCALAEKGLRWFWLFFLVQLHLVVFCWFRVDFEEFGVLFPLHSIPCIASWRA